MTFSLPLFLEKVRDQVELSQEEVKTFISQLDSMPMEQAAAFLGHAYHQRLSNENMVHLTLAMRDSGKKLSWDNFDRPVVDKHSTGGVGDKVSLCLGPILAALGLGVPMITGRSLGHTGGTIDKYESIPGFSCNLALEQLEQNVREIGFAVSQQTDDIAPADKKLYALRDITRTVESVPLIAASILSKKLAEGLDSLVLDVKYGTGAFMGTLEEARELAKCLVDIATTAGTKTRALITSMNDPIGLSTGHICEIREATNILRDTTNNKDLWELTRNLAAHTLLLVNRHKELDLALNEVDEIVKSGSPLSLWSKVVEAQGGDPSFLDETNILFPQTRHEIVIEAENAGTVTNVNARLLGEALITAGAGRQKQGDKIDTEVSLLNPPPTGTVIEKGDVLCRLYLNDDSKKETVKNLLQSAIVVSQEQTQPFTLIEEIVG